MVLYTEKEFSDKGIKLKVVAPGHKKEDFKLEVQEDVLIITLEDSYKERYMLPSYLKTEEISAEYDAGILYIDFPREKPKTIKIN